MILAHNRETPAGKKGCLAMRRKVGWGRADQPAEVQGKGEGGGEKNIEELKIRREKEHHCDFPRGGKGNLRP